MMNIDNMLDELKAPLEATLTLIDDTIAAAKQRHDECVAEHKQRLAEAAARHKEELAELNVKRKCAAQLLAKLTNQPNARPTKPAPRKTDVVAAVIAELQQHDRVSHAELEKAVAYRIQETFSLVGFKLRFNYAAQLN